VRLVKGTDYADGICLRMHVLSIFPWLFYGIMSTYLLILTWAMVKFRKSSVFTDRKGNQAVKDEQ
jgi:Na+/H+ antiporter NhaC